MSQQITREQMAVGFRILAIAAPSKGKVFECTHVRPVGFNVQSGRYQHFVEYDFRELESGRTRTSFTLNHINRYFVAAHD